MKNPLKNGSGKNWDLPVRIVSRQVLEKYNDAGRIWFVCMKNLEIITAGRAILEGDSLQISVWIAAGQLKMCRSVDELEGDLFECIPILILFVVKPRP